MDLSGNVFFNVSLSFWTNSSSSSSSDGNLLSRKSSPGIETHSPAKSAAAAATAAAASIYEAAISDKTSLGNNESTSSPISSTASPGSRTRSALFKEDLVKLVLINEGKGNSSIVDDHGSGGSDDSVDIINRHINGGHLFDSLDLHRAGNQSDHSSIGDSLASLSSDLLSSHYRDASLAHQQSLPSLTSITDGSNPLLSASTSATLSAWNSTTSNSTGGSISNNASISTFASLSISLSNSSNWSDLTHLNNALSDSVACLDDLATGGCLFRSASSTTASTNLTHGLDLDSHEREYWALFLILLPILALFGNVLVILSVYRERSLQTVTNWFIVSLAFADLFVTIPMLFSLYVMVNVDWELSDLICDLYIAIDVICSTASIFNLVAISFDRYIAVTHPIFYSKHKNDKRVIVTIILVWMASSGVGLPIMLGANTSPERTPTLCIFYNSDFIIYSSLWSFYVPCLIMVILYYKIFKAIHDRARKKIDSTKGKPSSNNANVSKNNVAIKGADGRNHMQSLENAPPGKQGTQGKSNAIKMEQIKVPIENRNHIQTSVALISEINIATAENNNSNNTESHLEDEEEEDEEDLEEGEEIEIKQLNNRCSSQFNSDGTCNCSIYANASDKLHNANLQGDGLPLKAAICQHRLCQKAHQDAVVDIEPGNDDADEEEEEEDGEGDGEEGHLATTMFIVENASTSLKLQHSNTSVFLLCWTPFF
ncbi:G-protein coupled receptor, partial [Tyrophagus putrescentiae]